MSEPTDDTRINNPHDKLFRRLMSKREGVIGYIEHFYPALAEQVDLSTLETDESVQVSAELELFALPLSIQRWQRIVLCAAV